MCGTPDAPGELDDIECLANTVRLDRGTDDLADLDGLRRWLDNHGRRPDTPVDAADLAVVTRLRSAVRDLIAATTDGTEPTAALAELDELARTSDLRVRFADDGPEHRSDAEGVAGVVGDLIGVVATAMEDGSWSRLKLCRADTCRWAYFDHSRNRSGRWCSMDECGNRTKARNYRRRHGSSPRQGRADPGSATAGRLAGPDSSRMLGSEER
jgi:predicted RNA-binding Zn ribbon-like protein